MRAIDGDLLYDLLDNGYDLDFDELPETKVELLRMIAEQPTVEPERKPGKWIDTGSGEECDQCHEIQLGYDSGRYFCANCGSMMTREVTYERGKP